MSKENTLFTIIGVLLGFIIGFMFANSVNQSDTHQHAAQNALPDTTVSQPQTLAGEHPAAASNADGSGAGGMMPDVQAKIQRAKDEPDNFQAQIEAAELYYQIKRFDRAIELLLRANQLRPENYEVVLNLGHANFEAKKYTEAERWYTTASIKKPDDINARTGLGLTFLLRQPPELDRAVTEFRRSLEIDPRHEQTLGALTDVLLKKGDAAQAQQTLQLLEQVNPTNTDLATFRSRIEQLRSPTRS
ncbi:MAG: tetratricopeptide repeat protein [Pyrinomonadaceae bacterium]|nr:tetratricopeptide repeat protein [Pyrinomonadaceae bacterium]